MKINPKTQKKVVTLVRKGQLKVAYKFLKKQLKGKCDADVWVALASICVSSGIYGECIKCCQSAIQLDSNHARAFSILGVAYISSGSPQKAIQLNEMDATVQYNYGYVLHVIEKYSLSAQHFLRSLDLAPGNALAHYYVASCYQAAGNKAMLIQHYKESLKYNPKLVDSMVRLATHYQEIDNFDRAFDYIDQALKISPDHQMALSHKAGLLSMTGDKSGAYLILRKLIDAGTYSALDLDIYSSLYDQYGDVNEVIKLSENMLQRMNTAPSDKKFLGFSLGRIYDKKGEYDLAFERFRLANNTAYRKFDHVSDKALINKMTEIYSREHAADMSVNDVTNANPIFIVGMPRSGTTLVEQVLSKHPEVHACGELPYVSDIIKKMTGEIAVDVTGLDVIRDFCASDIKIRADEYIARVGDLPGVEKMFTDKMPANYLYLGLISQIFPTAKILHCTRDPRDIVLSMYFQYFGSRQLFSNNLTDIAKVYLEYDKLMKHWKDTLNINIFDIKYEDLVVNFEPNVANLLEFCGLEFAEECLDFHKSKRIVATASFNQVNKPLYKKSLARWKNYEKHLAEVEDILKSVL